MTSPTFSTPRNTIVLNGSNNSFISLRIEDPKKASPSLPVHDEDVALKTMLKVVPEINQHFKIIDKLGEGTFSKVYKAKLRRSFQPNCSTSSSSSGFCESPHSQSSNSPDGSSTPTTETCYALKYLIPIVKPARIAKELRFLRDLRGLANIIPIKACFFNGGHTVLVMPIVEHDKFLDYFQQMDITEVRDYMRNLLIALERVHLLGIIHRDIKPANFLYNRLSRRYALVDFGLSQSQKELDQAVNYMQHEQLPRSAPKLSGGQSRVKANLSYRFQNNALIQHTTLSTKKEFAPRNLAPTLTSSLASTISLVKSKRSLDELENQVPKEEESQTQAAPVKRQRTAVSNANFIEMSHSTVFSTPQTPGGDGTESIFVPETPVKAVRTPLGNYDANQRAGQVLMGHTAPPVFNFNNQFTTPTKGPEGQQSNANKTPVKGSYERMFVPETPPKTVQKNLLFASGKKIPGGPVKAPQRENTSTSHIQNFSTPKTMSYNSFKRSFQSKKILAPELSTINSATALTNSATSRTQSSATNANSESQPCECIENSFICYACLSKPELNVPRAGTPGFRAPEILLRCGAQTPKLDIWSTGVIFASLLSGRYPFFRCMDDMTCLAEIVTILGSTKVKRAATALGKTLVISQKKPPMPLKNMCIRLRESLEANQPEVYQGFKAPDAAYDLLGKLLDPNPKTRYTASEALNHEFFMEPFSLDMIAD